MMANTDTRYYWNLTSSIYRFCPLRLGAEDIKRYHGFDERVSVENYYEIVNFFYRFIINLNE